MADHPFDDLSLQIPARLLVVETLLTLMLRREPMAARLMEQADAVLGMYEAQLRQDMPEADHERLLQMFEAARSSLDAIGKNSRQP